MVATAIFCSSLVAPARFSSGPEIRPAALISPKMLYTLGIITAGFTPIKRIAGKNTRIMASVKPKRSSKRPIMTLIMTATPTFPVKNTSTTTGLAVCSTLSKAPASVPGEKNNVANPNAKKNKPTPSINSSGRRFACCSAVVTSTAPSSFIVLLLIAPYSFGVVHQA